MKIPEYLQEDEMNEAMPIPPDAVDFSEYMWMADGLEEFDRAVSITIYMIEIFDKI